MPMSITICKNNISKIGLEEIFENREQIEISKFYERLPKAHSIALQELLEDKIYIRDPKDDAEEDAV